MTKITFDTDQSPIDQSPQQASAYVLGESGALGGEINDLGVTFSADAGMHGGFVVQADFYSNSSADPDDRALHFAYDWVPEPSDVSVHLADGGAFDIGAMTIGVEGPSNTTYTITGYRDGIAVETVTGQYTGELSLTAADSQTPDALFSNVTLVKIGFSEPMEIFRIDDIEISRSVTVAAPTLALETDTGMDGDGKTQDGTIVVSGLDDAVRWEYSYDGGQNWIEGDASNGGVSSIGVSEEGSHLVTARQVDGQDNASPFAQLSMTLDTTAPDTPTISLAVDSGEIGDGVTNNGRVLVSGILGETMNGHGNTWECSLDGGETWETGTINYLPGYHDPYFNIH
ncbi:hypothetical protein [uncultured Jannaschia sp.]|uniref:hypothetical protein n=1 Tax=uncultured Jannaschia sp. TaxID=293347 RepID=UPI002636FCDD|nr:hypothetical protein [uncultured Jannaschia sp.]